MFAPKQILTWLSFYDRYFENITDEFILIPNGDLVSLVLIVSVTEADFMF